MIQKDNARVALVACFLGAALRFGGLHHQAVFNVALRTWQLRMPEKPP